MEKKNAKKGNITLILTIFIPNILPTVFHAPFPRVGFIKFKKRSRRSKWNLEVFWDGVIIFTTYKLKLPRRSKFLNIYKIIFYENIQCTEFTHEIFKKNTPDIIRFLLFNIMLFKNNI